MFKSNLSLFISVCLSLSVSLCLSLTQGVNNFVQYKFSHLPSKERQTIVELAKMFLNQINYWQLETPSDRKSTRLNSSHL